PHGGPGGGGGPHRLLPRRADRPARQRRGRHRGVIDHAGDHHLSDLGRHLHRIGSHRGEPPPPLVRTRPPRRRRVHAGLVLHHFRFPISSSSWGMTWNRSPTMPKSVISKIGASGSLLMAMMVLEVCMPARCWIAPEIPAATYSCGETVLPVWPTWNWWGYQPASVTAREAPTAAPRASARASMTPNPCADPVPRPPETTICASVRSGRSPFSATTCSVIAAAVAASLARKVTGEISAAPGEGSAAIAFGRTAMIRGALATRECPGIAPPKFGRSVS